MRLKDDWILLLGVFGMIVMIFGVVQLRSPVALSCFGTLLMLITLMFYEGYDD